MATAGLFLTASGAPAIPLPVLIPGEEVMDSGRPIAAGEAGGVLDDGGEAWPVSQAELGRGWRDGLGTIVSYRAELLSSGIDRQLGRLRFSPEIFNREFNRGIRTRDFFRTEAPLDSYNTERVGFARGPHAVLYSTGSPIGFFQQQSLRALTRRSAKRFSQQINSDGAYRLTADLNYPIEGMDMGLRFAVLYTDGESFRAPSRNQRLSGHGNWTWRIDRRNQLSISAEFGSLENVQPSTYLLFDRYTPWLQAGSPIVDEPRAQVAGMDGLEWVSGGNYPVYIEGTDIAVMDWRRMARGASPEIAGQRESRLSFRPDALPAGSSGYHSWMGKSNRMSRDYGVVAGFWEFVLGGWLSLEVAGQYETGKRDQFQGLRDPDHTLQVDANRYLPDGSPNPFMGMPYIETSSQSMERDQDWTSLQGRIVGSMMLEPKSLHALLGSYQLGWLISFWRLESNSEWRYEVNTTPWDGTSELLSHASNRLRRRQYIDLEADAAPVFASSFAPIERDGVLSAFLPVGNAPQRISEATLSSMLSLQGRYLNDRLHLFLGVGRDHTSVAETDYERDALGLWPNPREGSPLPGYSFSKSRRTHGASLNLNPHTVLYYNKSRGINPRGTSQRDVFGERVPPEAVNGYETGLFIQFPKRRISANLSFYELIRANESSAALRGQKGTWVYTIWDAIDPTHSSDRFAWVDLQDNLNRGFEFDLVANVTPNLRIAWNLGRNQRRVYDVLPRFARYLNAYLPQWEAMADAPVNSAQGNTVGDLTGLILDDFDFERAQVGTQLLFNREWQTRVTANYNFARSSKLNGWSVGGNARWLERDLIGFASSTDGRLDRTRPFYGHSVFNISAWIGYNRRIDKAALSLRLQINNLLNDREATRSRAIDGGDGSPVYTQLSLPAPRSIQLTSNLRF